MFIRVLLILESLYVSNVFLKTLIALSILPHEEFISILYQVYKKEFTAEDFIREFIS